MQNPIVIVESPYAGQIERNLIYARRAMRDCFSRGEIPYASHLLYTQPGVLDDLITSERKLGIEAGYAFWKVAEKMVVYTDYGISPGMNAAMTKWKREFYFWASEKAKIESRTIGINP